jgi:hypothetical protein
MKHLTILKITAVILFLAMGISLNAQDKSEFKTKLDQLKGKVDKVTVNIDGKDVVFEGKDAEKLVKIVKPMAGKNMMWFSNDSDDMDIDGTGHTMMFSVKDDGDEAKDEGKKKIQIEIKDGKKNITVTTTDKDGKEEVKKYEGEEAEKFIKEHEAGNGMAHKRVKIITDGDGDEDCNMVVFNKKIAPMHGCCCCSGRMSMMRMPGMGKHKLIMKMMDGDDDEDVLIEKKIQKERETKTEKKEMKKAEKK